MSDLPASERLFRPAGAQLPVSWYFDPQVLALERRLLFDAGANYAGHELMTPAPGDWQTLAWMDHSQMLVRGEGGVELLSNVCRHRQAIIREGRGNAPTIVCPFHRWTYALDGALLGAPHFAASPERGLESTPLVNWRGLQFRGPRDPVQDLARVSTQEDWDFEGYAFHSSHIEEYPFNWKTFIEVYLEVYHVDPFHPGLGNFTDCDRFSLDRGAEYSVQVVPAKNALSRPGTPVYRRWHEVCRRMLDGQDPRHGALWLTYFPGLMLEWYPNVLVVSHLIPRGPQHTTNVVEFYYPEGIANFEPEFVEAQQAAYRETAIEDAELCRRMDRGRRALWQEGRDDAGPCQSPMEDALVHFHEWIRARITPAQTA